MSEQARRNLTRALVGVAIVALIVFAYLRKTEVPRLVEAIANGTPAQRLDAVQKLVEKEKLTEAMEEAPRWVQYNCVAALAQMGDHEAMAQMLAAKWEFDDPIEQRCAALLIAWADSAVGPLVEALQNKDGNIRGGTLTPLAKIGLPAKEPLLELTGGWDQFVRDAVRDTFAKAEMAPLVTDDLIRILKEHQPRQGETPMKHLRRRGTAVVSLEAMKKPAFEVLIALLKYEDPDPGFGAQLRGQAAASLGTIANQTIDAPIVIEDAVTVINPLIGALSDPNWTVRRRAAAALGLVCKVKVTPEDPVQLQALAAPITPLIGLLSAAQPRDVRAAAAGSLGLIGAIRAAPALGAALANDAQREGAAQEIALALERIGGPAVPALAAALHHADPDVRELATATAASIGAPSTARPLAERLSMTQEPAVRVRRVAAGALRSLAEAAYDRSGSPELRTAMEAVLPDIAGALADSDWHVYVAARDALARTGSPAVPHLINAMVAGDPRISYTASEGLASIGLPAVPQLLSAITQKPESDLARWAAIALGDVGSPAVPQLVRALQDSSISAPARANAARALGLTHDQRATKALFTATRDLAVPVRIQAIRSLAELRDVESEQKPGEGAVIDALADSDPVVRDAAMRVLEGWPGVTAAEALQQRLDPPSDENTRRRAAIVFASQLKAGMRLGMVEQGTEEQTRVRDKVTSVLGSALADDSESPTLRGRALELYGTVASVRRVSKEVVQDPASADLEQFISAADPELTHAACRALAAIGAHVSREIMREARIGLTPEPSQAAKILVKHLEAPERPELAPWYALALAEVRETAVRTLLDAGDPNKPTPPTGLLMQSPVPTSEQLLAGGPKKPTILWATAVMGRIGKPAVDVVFDALGKLSGIQGTRALALEELHKLTKNYDFDAGPIVAAVGADGTLSAEELPAIQKLCLEGVSVTLEQVRPRAETIWQMTRRVRWLHAAMLATRDTLARDFVDNVEEFDLLSDAEYAQVEARMDELARLKVAEW